MPIEYTQDTTRCAIQLKEDRPFIPGRAAVLKQQRREGKRRSAVCKLGDDQHQGHHYFCCTTFTDWLKKKGTADHSILLRGAALLGVIFNVTISEKKNQVRKKKVIKLIAMSLKARAW